MEPLILYWDPLPGLIALALTVGWFAQRRFRRGNLVELLGDVGPEDPFSGRT
jgi:hypothetical protein